MTDPGCTSALTDRLGHGPPFSGEELASVESLTVCHARDLGMLEPCVGLRHLRIVASEVADFLFCEPLVALEQLEVHCSRVDSLSGAAFCSRLERVDLLFTSLADPGDLFGLAAWRRGCLVGNPWSGAHWGSLREEARRDDMHLVLPAARDTALARRLWERHGVCADFLADATTLLVRPGLPTSTPNRYDAVLVPTEAMEEEPDAAAVDRWFREATVAPDLSEPAWAGKLGQNAGARRWLATSGMDPEDHEALLELVERFPTLRLFRASEPSYTEEEREIDRLFPGLDPARRLRLEPVIPLSRCPLVRFARFDEWSPRASRATSYRYDLGLRAHGDDTRAAMLAAGFVVIGVSREEPRSTLATRLVPFRVPVYEYSEEDILDALAEGKDVARSVYPVFPTFQDMLRRVDSLVP